MVIQLALNLRQKNRTLEIQLNAQYCSLSTLFSLPCSLTLGSDCNRGQANRLPRFALGCMCRVARALSVWQADLQHTWLRIVCKGCKRLIEEQPRCMLCQCLGPNLHKHGRRCSRTIVFLFAVQHGCCCWPKFLARTTLGCSHNVLE
jgi:hypothetical protein